MSGTEKAAGTASADEALRLAVVSGNPPSGRPQEIVERIRQAADQLESARQESSDLRAGLSAMKEMAERDAAAAQERIGAAERRAKAEATRAETAERRLAEAEQQISELLEVIQEELGDALRPKAGQGPDRHAR